MTRISSSFAALALGLMASTGFAETQQPDTVVAQNDTATAADAPIPQAGGYSNISNAQLQKMIDDGVTVIDIRLEEEWLETGIVEGVTPITFFNAKGQINPQFLPEFTAAVQPDQPVVLICRSGNRTQVASKAIAQQLGYKNVFNVTHGIKGWLAEKRPVVSYK